MVTGCTLCEIRSESSLIQKKKKRRGHGIAGGIAGGEKEDI
jgi:hypothetical protein